MLNLEISGISKRYPGVVALDGAQLEIESGKVHGLVGANGAGKSTLIKIIAGLETPDKGLIKVKGKETQISSPADSTSAGLAFIHQDLAMVNRLSIAENLQLAALPSRFGFVNRRELQSRCEQVMADCLPGVDSEMKLEHLSVAQKWMLSIARMILADAHTIFLDEPTAALGQTEVAILFETIRRVTARGCSVVFVSHRLEEILEISEVISVMNAGQVTATVDASSVSRDDLVELITGTNTKRDLQSESHQSRNTNSEVLLSIEDVSNRFVKNIDLKLFRGEVVGVAGLVGSGRSELLETIYGLRPIETGEMKLKNVPLKLRGPGDAVKVGIALLPEDRKTMAMLSDRSIRSNTTLVFLKKFASRYLNVMDSKKEDDATKLMIERLKVKAVGTSQLVRELSGGNQQKVVVARWLCGNPTVVLADEPTTGVDVGAKVQILGALKDIARDGNSVVIVSSEISELVSTCDRIIVMRGGEIFNEIQSPATERQVLAACFGEVA